MEEEKNCKNCGYYIQHYVKCDAYILSIECGHCAKKLVTIPSGEGVKLKKPCDYWTPQENKKEKRRKMIKAVLRDMEKSLEDIKIILQSDED